MASFKEFINEGVLRPSAAIDHILDVNKFIKLMDGKFSVLVKQFNKELKGMEQDLTRRRRSARLEDIEKWQQEIEDFKKLEKQLDKISGEIDGMDYLTSK